MEERAISSDLIRGHIDTIILHTLLDGDKFAQQISEAVEEKSDGDYKINQATLYSSLKRLENLKYVTSYWYDSPSGRRKYFKLTDSGKNTVENNLSNWSYSRAIIDKLMDCAPQPIYKIEYVEKTVPVSVATSAPIINEDKNIENLSQKPVENVKNSQNDECQQQEINFRNILNGLIKTTVIQQETKDLEPLEKVDIVEEKQPEKLKFNDTLSSTDYNAQKLNNNGKIDFGDLTLKAAKEGYKIRISSKDSAIPEGTLLINKLKVCSSMILSLIMLIELLYFSLRYSSLLNLNFAKILIAVVFILIYPSVSIVKYLKNPQKKVPKKFSADIILTSAIVIFNLFLITFAANLLSGVDFENKFTILLSFIMPTVLYLDVFGYFIIKYFIAKSNYCILKK